MNESNPFSNAFEEIRFSVVKRYCKDHNIAFDTLSKDEKENLLKIALKENADKQEELRKAEEAQKKEAEAKKRESIYNSWLESYVPKRYKDAKRSDFMDSVAPLFSLEQSALIIGGNGIGKSHLAWAIAKEARKSGRTVEVINLYRLLSEIKATPNWYDDIDMYARFDVLIIDEYDKCHGSESDFVLLSELVDKRYDEMLPTIVIGNGDDQQAQKLLGQSVYSRLTGDGGRLYKLGGTDRRRKN